MRITLCLIWGPLKPETQGRVPSWLGLRVMLSSDAGIINLGSMDLLNFYTKSCCSVYVHFWGAALVFIRSPRWFRKVKDHYCNHSVYSHGQNWSFLGHFHVFQGYRGCLISRCVSSPHLSAGLCLHSEPLQWLCWGVVGAHEFTEALAWGVGRRTTWGRCEELLLSFSSEQMFKGVFSGP